MNSQNLYSFTTENLVNNMAYCKIIWNADGKPIDLILLNAHPNFSEAFKITDGRSILTSFNQLLDNTVDVLDFFETILQTGQQNSFQYDLKSHPIKVNGFPLQDGHLIIQILNSTNDTSYYDELTGLYNRSYFTEEVRRLNTIRQLPISLIVGDINGLERINNTFGRLEGDHYLKELATILKSSCRTDDVVCRWDGDEFRIFLPKTDNSSVQIIINRIYRACKRRRLEGMHLNLSLGYATRTSIQEDINNLFFQAASSMNKHKLLDQDSAHNSHIYSVIKLQIDQYHETKEHAQKILNYSLSIGQALNLSEDYLNDIKLLTVLHNIGTLGATEKILSQPKRLDEEEWLVVKKHPEMGFKIVKEAPHLAHVADSILYHHERWDGKGYPSGLSGNNIPLFSRILAVADAYDAMTSPRAYRDIMPAHAALDELKSNAGTQFDPTIVKAFIETLNVG